ncbi:MAG: YybH family protein [Candidatus Limnocylindria bacterium]
MSDSSDSKVLDALRQRTIEAYAAADVERSVGLYVDEAVQQPPGRSAIVGREAIGAAYRLLFAQGGLSLQMEAWDTVVARPEARERGAYRLAAGGQALLAGKYMFIARETAPGEWRYVWTTVTPD